MHEMQTIAAADCGVCLSVCLSVTRLWCAETAERIEILFGVKTPGSPGNSLLDGGPDPPRRGEEKVHLMQPLSNYFGLLLLICVHCQRRRNRAIGRLERLLSLMRR